MSQPDAKVPDRLVGTCLNEGCRQVVIIGQTKDGRWIILQRQTVTAAAC